MAYKVEYSFRAEEQLDNYVSYIADILMNPDAAASLMDDADETVEELSEVAASLAYCSDHELASQGYRSIHFRRHQYHFVYQIEDDIVQIKGVYHDLQDYEAHQR